jgi:hypothetical protein
VFNVGILLCEDITWEIFEEAIRSKYTFTEQEIAEYASRTVFANRPSLVSGNNILFVDGGLINTNTVTLLFKNIIYFACGNKEVKNNNKKNVWILQDDRVYEPVACNGINYKKRILFDKLKPVTQSAHQILVYATKNCRSLPDYTFLKQYNAPVLVVTNKENQPDPIPGFTFVVPPVHNLFELFDMYVYTPVTRKWDCSPRFIAECVFYNKQVVFHEIDYWDKDLGLYWRKWDIDHDFASLHLRHGDDIIGILKSIVT